MIEPRIKVGVTLIGFLLLMLLFSSLSNLKEDNLKKEADLLTLSAQGQLYTKLKRQWDQPKQGAALLEKLKTIYAPAESYTKNHKLTIRYKELDQNRLNNITHEILTSDAVIIKLTVEKEEKGSLVELEVAE